jgi:predicted kinase
MLILICGLPATGKSTVARRLAKLLKAEVLRTDTIRKKIFHKPSYTEGEKDFIYKTLFLLADILLKYDVNVIIDGTFYKEKLRREPKNIAARRGKKFFLIETRCPEDIVIKRLEGRKRNLRSPSDADISVYYKRLFEDIRTDHIVVDTGWNIDKSISDVLKKIKV